LLLESRYESIFCRALTKTKLDEWLFVSIAHNCHASSFIFEVVDVLLIHVEGIISLDGTDPLSVLTVLSLKVG